MSTTSTTNNLGHLVADYQVFYQKIRNYHWTVKGPLFFGLHAKFEELYLDAAEKIDALAERILALGDLPPSTLESSLEMSRLHEDDGPTPTKDMVRNLLTDIGRLNGWLRDSARDADTGGDQATANLLDEFADGQEKEAWMLRAFLAD